MKKITYLTMVVLLLLGIFSFNVSAQRNVSVYIEGEKVEFDVQPQIINERTMVPMRKIFEQLGATVDWEQTTQTITGKKEDTTIIMQIDNNELSVNDNVSMLDVPPVAIDGRTLVPVRAIAESFGIDVLWYGDIDAVAIYNDKNLIEKKDLYNLKGESVQIDVNFEDNYIDLGWSSDISKIETVCMYAPDGKTKFVYIGNVADEIAVGWYTEPVVTLYALDGRTINVCKSEVPAYKNVGWYETLAETQQTLYALDGRTITVYKSEVPAYKNVGWYETLAETQKTMYAPDGRTITVYKSEVPAYKNVGWYETYGEAQAANTPSSSGNNHNDYNYEPNYNNQPNSGGSAVYRTPSGKRYHFDPNCGGKNSYEVTLQNAKNSGLTPCAKCAQ